MAEMKDAVVVAYGRTPVTRAKKGSFVGTHPLDWASDALKGTLAKIPQLDPKDIDDIVLGTATPANELCGNIARMLVNRAGLPESIPGVTLNRFCSSGLQAISQAAYMIMAGQADVIIGGGVEFMSSKGPAASPEFMNKWLLMNYPGAYIPMGLTAENVAVKYNVTREEMDEMAVESHRRAYKAQQEGTLNDSIIPITVTTPEGIEKTVELDEGIRSSTTMEVLSTLKTCFIPLEEGGRVTAGNSSQTSDGASFVVMMSREKADELGIKPIARFVSFGVAGVPAEYMGIGPIYAVPKALKAAGLTIDDMDVIELNEAFASQAIVCMKELNLPKDKTNPWGGAIALGHPMGATGGFLLSKALDYLKHNGGRYALVTMCIGGGMGAAGVFEYLG